MRKKYKELDFEIIEFDTENVTTDDVITTSPAGNDNGGEDEDGF